jgi:hypothetical protein
MGGRKENFMRKGFGRLKMAKEKQTGQATKDVVARGRKRNVRTLTR